MNYKSKNILITGGAGYIGSHIAENLIKKKAKVIILDNLVTGYKKLINKKSIFIKDNIKNTARVNKILNKFNIDTIIHMAAYLNVSGAEKYRKKYYNNNVVNTLKLIKACKKSKVRNIIYSSSCSIYGSVNGLVNENTKPNPSGYYAFTKYKAEQIIKKYSKKYKYNYAILRYFNVAGASSSNKIGEIEKSHGHLFKNIAIQSLKKRPIINIYGNNYNTKDGTCIRDYIHVSDLSDIHIQSLKYLKKNNRSIILNCGYGKGYSVLDIANILKKINKNTVFKFQNRRKGDVGEICSNTTKLKKILKWKPKFNNIKKILFSAIKWEKKISKN